MTRVLVVDDIAENRYLLEAILKGNGFEVRSALNGAEALAIARDDPPGLVVSDILMPVMDGFELCRRWRADARLAPIPFVFYTATYTDDQDEAFALSLGADRFLLKPMKADELAGVIREVLAERRDAEGTFRPAPAVAEAEVLRQYSEVLFHKLERKVAQLESEVAERRRAEEEVRALNAQLEERIRDRTADLEFSNKELEAFSYSVSHDLRAPLRAIDGFGSLLASHCAGSLDPEGARLLGVIRSNAQRMSKLIDELLQFSRTARAEIQRSRIDMGEMARTVFAQVTTPEERARVDFRVADLPAASGDPALMGHVFTNLLSNAVKFTSGRDRPVIEVGGREEEGRTVYFVKDNGAGFDMRYAEKLFGVFQRLHSPTEFPGVGVGLAIVKRVVSRHGGRVWAEGTVDAGATFSFSLPVP